MAGDVAGGLRFLSLHRLWLMPEMSLQGVIRGKPIRMTISDKAARCPLDQVNRQFHGRRLNLLWVSDSTNVATESEFVNVAFVIDRHACLNAYWRGA